MAENHSILGHFFDQTIKFQKKLGYCYICHGIVIYLHRIKK